MMAWLLALWALGALAVVLPEVRLDRREILALGLWPLTVPYFATARALRRLRYTCRDCRGYYGDRETYLKHLSHRTNCAGVPRG